MTTASPDTIAVPTSPTWTTFDGHRRIAHGPLANAALAFKHAQANGSHAPVLIFDDQTGRSIDIDTRGTDDEVRQRFAVDESEVAPLPEDETAQTAPKGRGRPKLGVVAREVTLLPRHWEWLATQPGGASVILRKLVDEARHKHAGREIARRTQERAYHFMSAMAGDLPGFEEASRALFANDAEGFAQRIAGWPVDVREHLSWLASGEGLAGAA